MPKLQILYSPEFEIDRIRYTLEKLEWYHCHGYNPRVPAKLCAPNRTPSNTEIAQIVDSEYDASIYETQEAFLISHWNTAFDCSVAHLDKILPFLHDKYIVYLTRYGTGGSYDYPNTIYANITYWWETGLVCNTLHEATHLAIHPLIEKHKISHWQKERLVDLITLRLSKKYGRTQELNVNVSVVDRMFEAFYPDIKRIIANIAQGDRRPEV
jgi:hypothetical protein